jgi:hypothetical protein
MQPLQLRLHEERKARLQRIASIGKRRQIESNRAKLLEVPTMEPPKAEEPNDGLPAHLRMPEFDLSKIPPGKLTITDIQRYVAQKYGLKRWDLISESRRTHIVGPRQVAMYLSFRLLGRSLSEIGRLFRRDHTTVIHAVKLTKQRVLGDSAYCLAIGQMEQELGVFAPNENTQDSPNPDQSSGEMRNDLRWSEPRSEPHTAVLGGQETPTA